MRREMYLNNRNFWMPTVRVLFVGILFVIGCQATALTKPKCGSTPGYICRGLEGGSSAAFALHLEANQFLEIQAEQMGIDVVLRLLNPSGAVIVEIDSPNGSYGPEQLFWIARETGIHRVEVAALDPHSRPGRFGILIRRKIGIVDELDRAAVLGQQAYLRAASLRTAKDQSEADINYKEAVTQLLRVGRYSLAAQVVRVQATVLCDHNENDEALKQDQAALAWARRAHDPLEQQFAWTWLGRDYGRLGKYQLAMRSYENALALNVPHQNPELIAATSINLGGAAIAVRKFDEAITYCNRAIDTKVGGGITAAAVACLGEAHSQMERYYEALQYF